MEIANFSASINSVFVNCREDFPPGEHFAIIKFSSVHIPADQRSIEAPGHGYPARDQPTITYQYYLSKEDWEEAIRLLEIFPVVEKYVAVRVITASVKKNIEITIN